MIHQRYGHLFRNNRWQTGDESWKTRGQFHLAWCPELRIKYAVFVESSRNGRGLFKSRENTFMIGIPCWIKSSVFKLMVIMIDIHLVTQWFYVMNMIVLSILNVLLNCWSIVDVAFKWIWCRHEIFMWKFWDELHMMQIAHYILQFIHAILTKGGHSMVVVGFWPCNQRVGLQFESDIMVTLDK